jgi:hypothetical protein
MENDRPCIERRGRRVAAFYPPSKAGSYKELACNQYLTHQDFAWQWLARYLLIIGGIEN